MNDISLEMQMQKAAKSVVDALLDYHMDEHHRYLFALIDVKAILEVAAQNPGDAYAATASERALAVIKTALRGKGEP